MCMDSYFEHIPWWKNNLKYHCSVTNTRYMTIVEWTQVRDIKKNVFQRFDFFLYVIYEIIGLHMYTKLAWSPPSPVELHFKNWKKSFAIITMIALGHEKR